jgi:hypothetical protein
LEVTSYFRLGDAAVFNAGSGQHKFNGDLIMGTSRGYTYSFNGDTSTCTIEGAYTQSDVCPNGTFNTGTGTIIFKGNFSKTNGTFNATSGGTCKFLGATVATVSGTPTFYNLLIDKPYSSVTFSNGVASSGSATFTAGTEAIFGDNTSSTFYNVTWVGTCGKLVYLTKTSGANVWTVTATGTITVDYVLIKDSTAAGSYSATHSIDAGNNTNWTFTNLLVIRHVKPGGPGTSGGLTWATAFANPQAAMDAAQTGDILFVAPGTYVPSTADGVTLTMRASFPVYGGYQVDTYYRNPQSCSNTALSGDRDSSGGWSAGDAHHVVQGANTCLLDGLHIEYGYYDGGFGAGLYCNAINGMQANNCTFHNNKCYNSGGAVYINGNGSTSDITFTNCGFSYNQAVNSPSTSTYAGAIYADNAHMDITQCSFDNNKSYCGGAVYLYRPQLTTIQDSNFTQNFTTVDGTTVSGAGGAIEFEFPYLIHSVDPVTVSRCLFDSNTTRSEGGAMRIFYTKTIIERCTFKNNRATGSGTTSWGGAIYVIPSQDGSDYFHLVNSVFYDNTAVGYGGALSINGGTPSNESDWDVYNCTFYNNTAAAGNAIIYAGDGNDNSGQCEIVNCLACGDNAALQQFYKFGTEWPRVGYCRLSGTTVPPSGYQNWDNVLPKITVTQAGFVNKDTRDLHITSSSYCKNTGTSVNAPTVDRDGNPRPYPGTTVDIGAYEYQGP